MRKSYGSYRTAACPFCGAAAYSKNKQGVPVCAKHKHATLGELKCACGEFVEQKEGKWGVFFVCPNCGPVNMQKILSVNEIQDESISKHDKYAEKREVNGRTETVVRSDDPLYFS